MQKDFVPPFHANRWLYFFIVIHLICWTTIPALVRNNLPLDAIEGTIWGQQLQFGYDKNPFLNGWLTALAVHFSDSPEWIIYLFSQLSVAICFFCVWLLAKNILTPVYALISVMLLEGIQYYNFHAIDFNDNTLELSTWALTIYFFYRALRKQNKLAWILTGLFAGIALMAKYYTAVLLMTMIIFLFFNADNRKQLKTLPPYIGLLTFGIVVLPHIIWLCFHDFITVNYVLRRASTPPSWKNHFIFPIQFVWQQLQAFLPALFLFFFLLLGKKPTKEIKIASFDKSFLLFISIGPLLLTILLPIIFGNVLRAGYGQPLLSLWGILLLAYIQPQVNTKKLHIWLGLFFTLFGISLGAYSLSLIDSSDPSSANYPGREIAKRITQTWREHYHTPLKYVAGSRWIGGNISFYSADHPEVFVEWNEHHSPWIKTNDVEEQGAVFVWGITDNEMLPKDIQQRFPQLVKVSVLEIPFKRNKRNIPPIKIGIALLPPHSHCSAR